MSSVALMGGFWKKKKKPGDVIKGYLSSGWRQKHLLQHLCRHGAYQEV